MYTEVKYVKYIKIFNIFNSKRLMISYFTNDQYSTEATLNTHASETRSVLQHCPMLQKA